MRVENGLEVAATATTSGFQVRDRFAATDDGELFATFDCIQQVGELPSCFSRTHISHGIRLSDTTRVEPPVNLRGCFTLASCVSECAALNG